MDTTRALRYDYRKTWETFSRHTNTVHKLAASLACAADKAALAAEMRLADTALTAHKEARDRLAAVMIPALAWPAKPYANTRTTGRDTWPAPRHSGSACKGATA